MIHSEKPKHRSDEEMVKELCTVNGVSYEKIAQEGSNISSLEIFFSGFPRMVGLSFFPRLCQLTIVGQDIKCIEGLDCCPLLRELWVVQCHLTRISGLQNCLQLEKLYLYDNEICEIENLELQTNLEVLWLNNNCITHIQGLNTLQNLKELNLADNVIEKIGRNLDANASLESLNLSGNKISSFKELTLLACLPNLRELALKDPTSTPNPVCLLCNYATHVLYHMPGLQQLDMYDVSNKQAKEAAESTVMKKIMYYNMCVRTAQRTLAEARFSLTEKKKTLLQLPDECIRTLNHARKNVCTILEILNIKYFSNLAKITLMMEHRVQFLLMELESVGNIHFTELRIFSSDYKIYSITGIKINKVVRIHNSVLRLRFEDKLHSLLASEDSVTFSQNYKHQLEYLLYAADPEKNCEKENVLCIVEEGFNTAEQHKEGAIPLSNSLSVTEQPRIEHALHQALQGKAKHSMDAVPFRHGQVIISKVFVGHSMPIREGEPVDRTGYPRTYSVYRSVDNRHRASKAHTGPKCSPRQRQWFVFDHELVLPEYIVYFEYITRLLSKSKRWYNIILSLSRNETPSNDIILDNEVLNMEPVLKPQPKLFSLDEKILVLNHQVLNLHGNSLSRMQGISRLTALRHLTISFNEFTHLDDIAHMPNLEFLDASYNHLVTLEGLRGLGQLKQLDVSWNKLTKVREDTAVLRKHTPALLKLDAQYNPWNKPEEVRMIILGHLTTLTHLNDVVVTEEEAANAVQMAAGSKINQASLLAHSRTNSDRPRSLSLLSTAQLLYLLCPAPWGLTQELVPDWTAKITALNLDGQKISKLINLNKLVNLRWASFNNNDISKVEGLDSCLKLEELSLNNNSISTLSGLSKLHRLNKLSVDGNQLSSLDASLLDHLPNLSFLSVENNCISSLHGIQRAHSLLELCVANNQISSSRDIYYLKGLTNLIILDLYGNPLIEKLENYRIYVVFHLPSLKALDGIEATECESAKDMFGGRLTPDMVAEKLGHSNYTDITYLTLQSCSIRMFDLSPADLFSSLRSVNLDHNNLTSFSGLIYLPNIKALCLNYNRIESILPRQKTQVHLTNKQILHSKVHSSGYGQQTTSKGNRETGPTGSLEPLMGSLEVLHLSHNGISNMANLQLSRLTNLKALFLLDNEISQVEGLEGLHQLRELVLDRNRIKALAENSFIAQNALLELHLAENRIRELNHLNPLIELRKLFLDLNKLQDVTELDKLEVLPSLTDLSVVGNPVSIINISTINIITVGGLYLEKLFCYYGLCTER
uniref:Leucine rich repeat containing 9 n=1 Tax=Monopterus albus TaxID=43700 RepID=A0A3Q3J496_MONAL